jgi:heme-degrading monooxygenase HmoA
MQDFGLVPRVLPRKVIRVPLNPFLVVWEFKARAGEEHRFENIYGPAGAWAKLFARDPDYLRTELQHDLQQPGRYLTLDYWTSEAAYDRFLAANQESYDAIDRECENLTEREVLVGRFMLIP